MMKNWDNMYGKDDNSRNNTMVIEPQSITLDDDFTTTTFLDTDGPSSIDIPPAKDEPIVAGEDTTPGNTGKKKKKKKKAGTSPSTPSKTIETAAIEETEPPKKAETPSKPKLDDELADLSVGEVESEQKTRAESAGVKVESKLWRPKFTLRSHMDSVRALTFSPNNVSMFSASEDGTVKCWHLDTAVSMKK